MGDRGGGRLARKPSSVRLPLPVAPVDGVAFAALLAVGFLLWLGPPLAIAAALLAGAVAAGIVSPVASVCGTVATLPLAYRPVSLGGGSYSLLELAIATGSCGAALAILSAIRRTDGRARLLAALRPWPTTLAAIGVFCAGTVSLGFLAEPDRLAESLREYRWTIVEPLAFFATCRWAFRLDAHRFWPAAVLSMAAAIVGVAALGEALVEGGLESGDGFRARLLYPHPNNLAFFLERAGIFAAGLALVGRRSTWTAIAAIFALAGVAATLSRGAILAGIVGMGVVLNFRGAGRRAWLGSAGLVGAFILALVLFAGGRLLDPGGADGEATRIPIWRSSVRMILDHPLTGVGLDQFYYQYWRRYVEPAGWPERYTSHPHNLLLDVWLRLGILGLAAFGWLVVALALVARRLPRRPPPGAAVAVASLAALAAGATHGLVDNGYFLPDLAVMTWFLIALLEGQPTGASADPT